MHYRGGGETVKDLLSGEVKMMFSSIAPVQEFVRDGRLIGLATTGPKRDPAFPDLPTIAKSGYPGFDVRLWIGMTAPAGTPKDIIHKLADANKKALKSPEIQKALAAQGFAPMIGSAEDFDAFYRAEREKWAQGHHGNGDGQGLGHRLAPGPEPALSLYATNRRSCVKVRERLLQRKRPWPGQPRPSSRSASASRSTAICRPNSDLAFRFPLMGLTAIVLGAAAGGGFPQWNCNCDVCRLAWAGDARVRARTQASLAVSGDGKRWTLLNASPDLRAQIQRHPRCTARR